MSDVAQVDLFAGPGEEARRGIVKRTRYHNEENGYTVVGVDVDGTDQTWVGTMPKLRERTEVQGVGKWESGKYGPQFKCSVVSPVDPTTADGIAEFLGSGLVAGIGPVLAERIVAHYGPKTLDVLENDLERVKADVRGIGAAKLEALRAALIEHKAVGQIMIWLRGHGVSASLATKLYKRYGAQAIQIVSDAPYRMAIEISGVGWKTADDLAQRLGTPLNAPDRIQAGLLHTLDEITGRGHCYADNKELFAKSIELLNVTAEEIGPQLRHLRAEERIVEDNDAIYPKTLYDAERNVAARLHALLTTPAREHEGKPLAECVAPAVAAFEASTGFTLAEGQRAAVELVASSKVAVITGGPGQGKAMPITTPVLTPDSWREIGTLRVGDSVIGRDGKTYEVLGVYPQGMRDTYRVTMEDGGYVDADGEHLWTVNLDGERGTITTEYVKRLMATRRNGRPAVVRLPWAATDPTPMHERALNGRAIKSIEPSGNAECVCIAVSSPDKLFVVRDHIVTHNTTITKCILAAFDDAGIPVTMVAPTGRAAKRMNEATGKEASTIHRLLSYDPDLHGFAFHKGNRMNARVLVLDESSMMSVDLMSSLLDALRDDARLIVVGDVDQLPSVGPGSVLRDVIDSGVVPTARLSVVYRQAAGSLIIDNAHRINRGEMPVTGPSAGDFHVINKGAENDVAAMVEAMVRDRIPKAYGFDPMTQIQVLTPMNKGPAGVLALNERLQAAINPPDDDKPEIKRSKTTFRLGDRVLETKNDYERGVFNGDIGYIVEVAPGATKDEPILFVRIDNNIVPYSNSHLEKLQLAYCTSIHKAQGGQQKAVIVVMLMSHFMMLSRNLLYTAVTRGEKLVVLVTEPRALGMALAETRKELRRTKLAQRLQMLADPGKIARVGAAKVLAMLQQNTANDAA